MKKQPKTKSLKESLKSINVLFWFFTIVGIILITSGALIFFSSLMNVNIAIAFSEGIMLIILAQMILRKQSRIASIILLCVSIIGFINSVSSPLGMYRGGTNFIVAIAQIIASIYSIKVTHFYHKLKNNYK